MTKSIGFLTTLLLLTIALSVWIIWLFSLNIYDWAFWIFASIPTIMTLVYLNFLMSSSKYPEEVSEQDNPEEETKEDPENNEPRWEGSYFNAGYQV